MTELAWEPTPEYVERANVTRLMRRHGIETIAELRRRSVEDVEWYWDAAVEDLGIEFAVPYSRVLDASRGVPWATWFEGGRVNLVHNCVDRWADREDTRDRTARSGRAGSPGAGSTSRTTASIATPRPAGPVTARWCGRARTVHGRP